MFELELPGLLDPAWVGAEREGLGLGERWLPRGQTRDSRSNPTLSDAAGAKQRCRASGAD
jgi:hypothetical protein